MYKLLLCWRYLRTRYLAMVCIVSVMLGVATLIVVNSVMGGFSMKLRERLHGLLSDIVLEARTYDGITDPEAVIRSIKADPFLKDQVEEMAPTMEVFAMLQFRVHQGPFEIQSAPMMRPVHLIGIDSENRARIPGFKEHLLLKEQRDHPSFELAMEDREKYAIRHWQDNQAAVREVSKPLRPGERPPPAPVPEIPFIPQGAIVGFAIAHYRDPRIKDDDSKSNEVCVLPRGSEIVLTTIKGQGRQHELEPVSARFVVVDYIKTEMSEYDSNYIYVPLSYLQQLRSLQQHVSSIQIKLKDYDQHAKEVKERLAQMFPQHQVQTWEDKQGPLLAAISVEKGLLNVLLFLIIAVAGFGILAIFSMIVVEKTRDIGILKALGASNGGVLRIFLGYGLLLGVVGSVLGTSLGVAITVYINEIEKGLAYVTGQDIFPRDIYYFDRIPTYIQAHSVVLVNLGALGIAILFCILPALRAALLHPVRALRYE